jgi:hypothetical protein
MIEFAPNAKQLNCPMVSVENNVPRRLGLRRQRTRALRARSSMCGKVEAGFPKRTCDHLGIQNMSRKSMPSGFDPMGGNRFSEKDMRPLGNPEHMPIQSNRDVLAKVGKPSHANPQQTVMPITAAAYTLPHTCPWTASVAVHVSCD